jgi:alpha-1,2-mannosyltransferase
MVGSTRNHEDRSLVLSLQAEAAALGITEAVSFVVNAPFPVLYAWLGEAQIGLHTMWNEHFGISIVEMMAAGLVTVAHKSGGPLMDLIRPVSVSSLPLASSTSSSSGASGRTDTGYLATTADEYAACIAAALDTYPLSLPLRERAREASLKYSDEAFQAVVVKEFRTILKR